MGFEPGRSKKQKGTCENHVKSWVSFFGVYKILKKSCSLKISYSVGLENVVRSFSTWQFCRWICFKGSSHIKSGISIHLIMYNRYLCTYILKSKKKLQFLKQKSNTSKKNYSNSTPVNINLSEIKHIKPGKNHPTKTPNKKVQTEGPPAWRHAEVVPWRPQPLLRQRRAAGRRRGGRGRDFGLHLSALGPRLKQPS